MSIHNTVLPGEAKGFMTGYLEMLAAFNGEVMENLIRLGVILGDHHYLGVEGVSKLVAHQVIDRLHLGQDLSLQDLELDLVDVHGVDHVHRGVLVDKLPDLGVAQVDHLVARHAGGHHHRPHPRHLEDPVGEGAQHAVGAFHRRAERQGRGRLPGHTTAPGAS